MAGTTKDDWNRDGHPPECLCSPCVIGDPTPRAPGGTREEPCPHGHALRRKCERCEWDDAQAEIIALRARAEAAERERDEARKAMDRVSEMFVKDVRTDDGLRMQLASEVWPLVAKACLAFFIESGGVNYVEMQFRHPEADVADLFTVTVQKWSGKTPHQCRQEAESRLATLAADRDRMADAAERMHNASRTMGGTFVLVPVDAYLTFRAALSPAPTTETDR